MRPLSFDEFVGQEHLTAPQAALRRAVESDRLSSVILWGPPGVGKTTLAEVIARITKAHFSRVSATSAGVADLRKVVEEARQRRKAYKQRTILFIDEIHRFNKAQQDAILPVVENGTVTLIGATTENPSFEVNAALLSRSRVYTMRALSDEEVQLIVRRALTDPVRGLGKHKIDLAPEAEQALVNLANGDARSALNILELAFSTAPAPAEPGQAVKIDLEGIENAVQRRSLLYDKGGEMHYDIISALHKSVRGSDPDATLYWLARMLESGEDPLYLARRLVRMASEDIGLADPQALPLAMAAQQAVHFIGMPEGALALAEIAVYLATAPKSNRLYDAYNQARADVQETRNDPVPIHLRNAPTQLMKNLGYGRDYKYAHNYEGAFVYQQNLPEALEGKHYYQPADRGYELELGNRLAGWRAEADKERQAVSQNKQTNEQAQPSTASGATTTAPGDDFDPDPPL
ncbi:MAG TPA: replication-associated recombination protein A [Chloroflexia bacterium]|nr:replication-associated recombination protein A [Chloroflexia bacterium]